MMFKERINAQKAKELFLHSFQPISKIETLPIEECDGRIIAENIIASIDVPHYRRAAMDGFAVMASETLGAGTGSPVMLRLANSMEKGTCMRVHTGSPMPEKSDAVVMMEDTVLSGD
ncbi:partial Molybdopterin molybdenumtransferase, partial [Methanosarcinales archaeon]